MKITIVLGQLGILSCSKALTLIIVLIKEITCDFLNVSGEVVCCVTRRPKLYSFRL